MKNLSTCTLYVVSQALYIRNNKFRANKRAIKCQFNNLFFVTGNLWNTVKCTLQSQIFFPSASYDLSILPTAIRAHRINLTKKKNVNGGPKAETPLWGYRWFHRGPCRFHLLSRAPLLIAGFGKNSTTKGAVNSGNNSSWKYRGQLLHLQPWQILKVILPRAHEATVGFKCLLCSVLT